MTHMYYKGISVTYVHGHNAQITAKQSSNHNPLRRDALMALLYKLLYCSLAKIVFNIPYPDRLLWPKHNASGFLIGTVARQIIIPER
jgi:hypothetical protein